MSLNDNIKTAFKISFENHCFQLLITAYNYAVKEKSVSLNWDENDITSQLHEYIDVNPNRIKWSILSNVEHHIPKQNLKKEKGFAAKNSRIDMRFATIKSKNEYKYFIEAKNLKENDSKLKRRYIKTGIDNYISEKYMSGCLVGYLIEGDINTTIKGINSLLEKDKRKNEVLQNKIFNIHDDYFESTHPTIGLLKHIILDFTP